MDELSDISKLLFWPMNEKQDKWRSLFLDSDQDDDEMLEEAVEDLSRAIRYEGMSEAIMMTFDLDNISVDLTDYDNGDEAVASESLGSKVDIYS